MNYAAATTTERAGRHQTSAVPTAFDIDVQDTAKLLLRVTLGVLILLHGMAKLNSGIGFITETVLKAGWPAILGQLVYLGEIVAPMFLIVGLWTRAAAGVVAIHMLVALLLVHAGDLASLNANGGWAIELQAAYLVMALAVALLGAGRYSMGRSNGRWN